MKRFFIILTILCIACNFLVAINSVIPEQETGENTNNLTTRYNKIVHGVVSMNGIPLSDVPVYLFLDNHLACFTFTTSTGQYDLYFDAAEYQEVTISIPCEHNHYGIYRNLDLIDNVLNTVNINLLDLIQNNNLMVGRVGYIEGFENIQDAMDYLSEYLSENQNHNNNLFTFYCNTEELEISNLDFSNLNLQNNVKVKLVGLTDNITFAKFDTITNLEISIHNMSFMNEQVNSAPLHILNSSNCRFNLNELYNAEIIIDKTNNSSIDITNSHFEGLFNMTPVRITLDDNSSQNNIITINKCTFLDSHSETTTPPTMNPPFGPGNSLTAEATFMNQDFLASVILMNGGNHSNNDFKFTNNNITYSDSYIRNEHGALLILDASNVAIANNNFSKCGNGENFYMCQSVFPGSVMTMLNSNVNFTFNTILEPLSHNISYDGGGVIGVNLNSQLTSSNNTYYNNYNSSLFRTYSHAGPSIIECLNDIYYNQIDDNQLRYLVTSISETNIFHVNNSISWNYNIYSEITNNNQNSIICCDPLLDSNLTPIWTESIKSPLIDNGTKHFTSSGRFIKQDDIGAREHTAPSIQNFRYLPGGQIHWISLPYLNKNNNSWHHVFHDWHDNGLLEEQQYYTKIKEIYTLGPDIENGFRPSNMDPNYNPNLPLYSQYGFKVDLSNQDGVYLDYHGFDIENSLSPEMLVNTSQGQIHTRKLYIPAVPVNQDDPGYDCNDGNPARRIYLGYYKDYPMSISHAFGPLLDDISVIQSKNWFAVRDINTNTWITGESYGGKILTLNPGEMIEVLYHGNEDAEFDWGQWTPIPPVVKPYVHDLVTNFKFEEKKGYLPIIINIDLSQYSEIDKPVEVALLVDEVCKGAAVIKEDQVILNAYILSDIPEIEAGLKEISFELWIPNAKGNQKRKVNYVLTNNSSQEVTYTAAKLSNIGNYLQVKLSDTDTPNIPKILTLYDNYPNPFNPETTISFDLPQDSDVKLEIFNIKGQKVKTIQNGHLLAGNHKLVWNGKNSENRDVASGLYFYQLTTAENKLTRKMILMK